MDATEDTEVRREDQESINEFGRLSSKLHDIKDEEEALTQKKEQLSDASEELMLEGSGDTVKLMLGEAFMEVEEDFATEYCDNQQALLESQLDDLKKQKESLEARRKVLKETLYARFGSSINLEE